MMISPGWGRIDDDITQRGKLPWGKENGEADVSRKNRGEAENLPWGKEKVGIAVRCGLRPKEIPPRGLIIAVRRIAVYAEEKSIIPVRQIVSRFWREEAEEKSIFAMRLIENWYSHEEVEDKLIFTVVQYIALLLQHTCQFLGGNPPYLSILVPTYMGLATKLKRCFSGNI